MGAPVRIFGNVAVSGVETVVSDIVVADDDVALISFHFQWQGAITGTFALYQSNLPQPGKNPTTKGWVPVPTSEVDFTGKNPAGAAGSSLVNISATSGSKYIILYANTIGDGLLDCFQVSKAPGAVGPAGSRGTVGPIGPAGVTAREVVNIADPVELRAIAGEIKGDARLVYQTKGGGDDWTLYAWDDVASGGELVPYSINGSSGRWQAIGGRFHYNGIDTPGEICLFATTPKQVNIGLTTLENTSTGLFKFDGLSIGDPANEIDIGAGAGHILDSHTDPDNPTYTNISFAAQSLPIADLTDGVITWVYIDPAGNAQQQTTDPTPIQIRENLHLGFLIVFGGIIIAFVAAPYVASNPMAQLAGLFDAIGTINLSVSVSNGGTDLTLDNSGGVLIARGISFDDTAAGRADPNSTNVPAANPAPFRYGTQSTFDPAFVTLIDPLNYDVAGVITPIPGSPNRATNTRIWMAPDGALSIQYGTVWYSSLTNAVAGSTTEAFINHPTLAQNNSVLLATLSMKKGALDLSDPADARFLPGSKFGEASIGGAGQSVTSIQQAYNNSLDGTIITDATRTAAKFQRGTTADTDDVLEVLNGAAGQVFSVTGEGAITTAKQSLAYTATNVTPDRTFNADATTLDELADIVGTVIADLKAFGVFS